MTVGAKNMQENKTEKRHSGFAAFFIHRPVFTIMISVSLMFLGFMGYRNMGVSMYPSMDIPVTLVQTVLPGASPEEIETSISKYIEEGVNEIAGVDEIHIIWKVFQLCLLSLIWIKMPMSVFRKLEIKSNRLNLIFLTERNLR